MKVTVIETEVKRYKVEINDDCNDAVTEALAHIRIYAKGPDSTDRFTNFEFERINREDTPQRRLL
jgi:hypothetical protein